MMSFIVRRLWWIVVVLLLVALITFLLAFAVPADPARAIVGPRADATIITAVRQRLGLNDPLPVQFVRYLWNLLHGDLGYSWVQNKPVSTLILERLPATLELAAAGLLVELTVGLPTGLLSAARKDGIFDRLNFLIMMVLVATPPFVLGTLFLFFLAYQAALFPLGGMGTPLHLVLPALTLGLPGAAWYSRIMRSSVLEVLRRDYVRTARAKGLRRQAILLHHVTRNALGPVFTMMGMDLAYFLGGVVLVETVFNWPGIGQQAYQAVQTVDLPLMMGTVIVASLAILVLNLLVDIGRSFLDPRVALA
ncbi:MAG TPA: ABC transporter permease [Chloroflexota bacterium]|nr:ABC transporter permease [Chloroflexota bacterium]